MLLLPPLRWNPPPPQFDAASYLSGDYPKLPEDGPAYSLSIGHAMQESTESHKMLLALKDAVEKYSDGKITITIYPIPSWAATLK